MKPQRIPPPPPPGRCETCRHYRPRGQIAAPDAGAAGGIVAAGNCTAHPPGHVHAATPYGPLTLFPVVLYDESCGEHQPRARP